MTDMLTVQKSVPLPAIDRTPKGKRRKHPVNTMAVGDMYFMPGAATKSVSAYISRITKPLPGTFSARHVWMRPGKPHEKAEGVIATPDTTGAKEGTGVWRTS